MVQAMVRAPNYTPQLFTPDASLIV